MTASTAELALRTQELIALSSFLRAGIITPEIILAGDNIALSIEKLTDTLSSEDSPLSEEGFRQLKAELDRRSLCVLPIAHA